jgi:hypothetical protein
VLTEPACLESTTGHPFPLALLGLPDKGSVMAGELEALVGEEPNRVWPDLRESLVELVLV